MSAQILRQQKATDQSNIIVVTKILVILATNIGDHLKIIAFLQSKYPKRRTKDWME
jgi:hypothetical protein